MQRKDYRRKKKITLVQAECLASPARTELLDSLGMLGSGGAHELADITGLSVNTIHYHLAKLIKVGLVVPAGKRPTATKSVDLFRLKHERMGFNYREKRIEYRKAKAKAIRQCLKLAEKESARSLFSEHGMEGAVHVRTSQKLSKGDVNELRRRLAELGEWARSHHDDEGEPVSLTALTVLKAH